LVAPNQPLLLNFHLLRIADVFVGMPVRSIKTYNRPLFSSDPCAVLDRELDHYATLALQMRQDFISQRECHDEVFDAAWFSRRFQAQWESPGLKPFGTRISRKTRKSTDFFGLSP